MPLLDVGTPVPDFSCETQIGRIDSFRDAARGKWTVLFGFPRDFTPICSTELLELVRLEKEFAQRKVQVVGLSTDTVEEHVAFLKDLEKLANGGKVWFPVASDVDGSIAKAFGMLQRKRGRPAAVNGKEDEGEWFERDATGRPATSRTVYVVSPELEVESVAVSPINTGRNFVDVLRIVDSLQVTSAQKAVGTPATWKGIGDRVVLLPSSRGAFQVDESVSASSSPKSGDAAESVQVTGVEVVTPYLSFADVRFAEDDRPTLSPASSFASTGSTAGIATFSSISPMFPAKRAKVVAKSVSE